MNPITRNSYLTGKIQSVVTLCVAIGFYLTGKIQVQNDEKIVEHFLHYKEPSLESKKFVTFESYFAKSYLTDKIQSPLTLCVTMGFYLTDKIQMQKCDIPQPPLAPPTRRGICSVLCNTPILTKSYFTRKFHSLVTHCIAIGSYFTSKILVQIDDKQIRVILL
jgi:type IV secretory pathway VirB3-like protein